MAKATCSTCSPTISTCCPPAWSPPLPDTTALPAIRDLNPLLALGEERLAMMTHYMAAVPRNELGRPLANLLAQADDITLGRSASC